MSHLIHHGPYQDSGWIDTTDLPFHERCPHSITARPEFYEAYKNKKSPREMNVEIMGVKYSSIQEASQCLGIGRETLMTRIKEGNFDELFTGRVIQSQPLSVTCKKTGKTWKSQNAAAKDLGRSRRWVRDQIALELFQLDIIQK